MGNKLKRWMSDSYIDRSSSDGLTNRLSQSTLSLNRLTVLPELTELKGATKRVTILTGTGTLDTTSDIIEDIMPYLYMNLPLTRSATSGIVHTLKKHFADLKKIKYYQVGSNIPDSSFVRRTTSDVHVISDYLHFLNPLLCPIIDDCDKLIPNVKCILMLRHASPNTHLDVIYNRLSVYYKQRYPNTVIKTLTI